MENSWQGKCSIPWPSSSPSPQFQSQGSRSQIDMTASHYMHPFVAHENGSIERTIRQEPTLLSSPNLGSVKSGKPELGNSFLALLSGPSNQLHFDYQQLLNSRSVSATNLPIHDSGIVVTGPSPGVSGPLTGNESMGNRAELSPFVVSRQQSTSTCNRVALSHDNLQMAGMNFHGSDSTKQSLLNTVQSNETGMDISFLRRGWLNNTIPLNTRQQHTINFDASPKISQEAKFSVSDLASSSIRGHPRVFCLNTSGDLLLSDVGRLGVICLCHNLHMSVAKFCEHSGSCAVNPGDVVRLESGETIGQWRKLHFTKFGLRVPDDTTGWDWADGSSQLSESAKHKVTMQCISKNSGIFQPVDPSGGKTRFDQHWNDLVSPNNPYKGHPVLENPGKKVIQNARQRNSLEGCNALLKNFVGTTHGILPTMADNQTIQTSKIAFDNERKNYGYQSNVQYIDSINRGENSFFSNQNFGNIISLDKGADVSRCDGSRETFIMDRDTIHSNIELRLGQPSQQSHTIVGPIPSSVRPQGISTLSDPHNTQFYGQLTQRAVNPRVTEESRRNLRCAPPDSLVTKHREKESQLNPMSHALRSLNAAENASLDQLKGLPPTGHFSISEGTVLQAAENNLNNCEHFMPRIFGGDSHLVKCGLGDFPRNIINGMERKLEMQGLGLSNHFDFGKGSGALADGSSYTPANTVLHRPTNSAMSSSYIPTSLPPATSVCFSATNPLYLSNLKSALQNKKNVDFGQHLFDENLRLLALRRIVEMSKQEHAITEMNRDQGRVHCPLALQMQKKASKDTLVTSVLRQGSCAMGSHDASEVAARTLQSCCNHCLGGSFEKLTCRSGSNKSCNFATSTHVMSLYPKESEVRDVHGTDEQPLLRLGRSTNNCTNDFGECVRCNHKEPNPCFIGNCTCALHSNCLTGSCVSRMENLANASKENIASIISKASNMLFSPDVKNNMAPKGKKNLPGRCKSVEMHDLMKSGCHSLQWREVPNKVTENCDATFIERPEEVNNAKETIEDQLADTAAKRSNGIIQETESLKEQQMSNICSANSAPAVTEFSVEGTVDTRKMRFMRNLVVDEGSGIEKCYSSDDAPDSGRWTPTLTGNIDLVSTSTLPTQSSHDRNEPKLTKLVRIKKAKNRTAGSCAVREKIHFRQISRDSNTEKKKRVIKWKRLDATLPSSDSSRQYDPPNYNRYSESHFHSCRGVENPLQIALGKQKSSLKRKRSTPSSNNILSHKPNLHGFDRHKREWGDANETQSSGSDDIVETPKLLPEMKAKRVFSKDAREQFPKYELNFIDNGKAPKYGSMCCSEHLSEQGVGTRDRHRRPVVCDNYGIITDGKSGVLPKPAKIVSLRLILKNARRCSTTGNAKEEVPIVPSASEKTEACFSKKDGWSDAFAPLKKGRNDEGHVPSKHGISKKCSSAWMKPSMNVSKEVRKRSLYELTRMEANIEKLACISYLEEKEHSQPIEEACSTRISPQNVLFDASNGKKSSPSKFYSKKASKYVQHTGVRSSAGSCLKSAEYSQGHLGETLRVNDKRHVIKGRKRQAFLLDADAFCCVCGSSNKDDFNRLLECNRCLIRVHQACYGVSKVPKGRWCCRPCRSNFENIVCVLCGYEGGAMTQALRSREIVKSLLQEWKIGSESMSSAHPSETLQDGLNLLNTSSRGEASSDAVSITRIRNTDALHRDPVKLNLQNDAISTRNSNNLGDCFQVHNTITAGVLDPGVKQWVHMVCGLWMPGTRCPNVDTMSAFDVSGVSRSRKNVVCSICNRRGGSCIQCRVADCSVLFHPWCAHQKGLLQSEIEGIDNEKVGFYGRCVLHATFSGYCPGDTHLLDGKLEETHENRESTCARTEGYKGRKRDKGFRLNLHGQFSNGGGCLVPQEQINAWLHINGQKSSTRGPVKPPVSDIEYDCRQEYARYKQAKGWKHLVVYKSGIHALGLYTSQYISRGAMVVEYVGEIVGLRVADKREAEYQSGRGVQYKSACYFFRIDKEHIIDATRKGGIARFVNHSCLPNCVAKVISVRNEKKVVFFAERDINPGEEITYDYNFNHEDEGKKIPCFCNSKNCRLYLN